MFCCVSSRQYNMYLYYFFEIKNESIQYSFLRDLRGRYCPVTCSRIFILWFNCSTPFDMWQILSNTIGDALFGWTFILGTCRLYRRHLVLIVRILSWSTMDRLSYVIYRILRVLLLSLGFNDRLGQYIPSSNPSNPRNPSIARPEYLR